MGRGHVGDEELMKMIKNGGKERKAAITQIYYSKGLRERVANYVSYHGGGKEQGLDMFSDALVIVERNIRNDKFRGDSAITTYTYGVAKLCWANKSRMMKQRMVGLDEIPSEFSDYQNPELIYITDELKGKLNSVLELLNVKCVKILRLWSNDAKYKEIALELGVENSSQLRKMKYDCQRKLKERLLQQPDLIPNYYNGEPRA